MGDRCYMTVFCRPQDVPIFEEIGFTQQEVSDDYVEMVDEEANYAHSGDMPDNIPYYGNHGDGGDYGSAEFACDGEKYDEWETGRSGGYVIEVPNRKRLSADERQERWTAELVSLDAFQDLQERAVTIVQSACAVEVPAALARLAAHQAHDSASL